MKDQPVCISLDDLAGPFNNLGQTASEIWLFSHVFAFFGGEHAHHCPNVWKTLLTMLEITGICLGKKMTINILGYLKGLIKEHLQLFKYVFNQNITPKQHFLIHNLVRFCDLVLQWECGLCALRPSTNNWRKFQRSLKTLKTFQKHCLKDTNLEYEQMQFHCQVTLLLQLMSNHSFEKNILRFYPTFRELSKIPVYQAASVRFHETWYKKDLNTVLLAEFIDRNPVFGSLQKIWLRSTYIFLPETLPECWLLSKC